MWTKFTSILANAFAQTSLSAQEIFNIVFSLGLAIIIGWIISQVYKRTHRGLNYEISFLTTLILLAPIVTAVMIFIQGSLVLSLGLVGSLSIIRFRAPIKDTRDMVFLFWVITTGLGCGIYNWSLVVIFTLLVMGTVIILYLTKYGHSRNQDYVLILSGVSASSDDEVERILKEHTFDVRVRSRESENDVWEIIYEVRFRENVGEESKQLVQKLQALSGIQRVSLLAPQLALPA
ncbi:MAG TPA: DUF4956 domain-containing protein [Anaerolineales bacterium]|nr:DUF4956 domain-containing protein [Anaerolineales bacterium]